MTKINIHLLITILLFNTLSVDLLAVSPEFRLEPIKSIAMLGLDTPVEVKSYDEVENWGLGEFDPSYIKLVTSFISNDFEPVKVLLTSQVFAGKKSILKAKDWIMNMPRKQLNFGVKKFY